MYHCGMRQVGERLVAYQVDLMVWSNRLDLLALSNFKGEVHVHRLHWQKVWMLQPPKENVTVQAMAWRPDGKALAIGYSCGVVLIVDIEDKEVLSQYELQLENPEEFGDVKQSGITCIMWAVRSQILESAVEPNIYDDASIYLQSLPFSSEYKNQTTEENSKDLMEVQLPNQLNMLLIGYGTGYIYFNMFGRYPFGTIHLAQVSKDDFGEYKVLDICMSDDFSFMQVLYIDRMTNNLYMSLLNTNVLSAYADEVYIVAKKHSEILRLICYLDLTMTSITEAWENILLEMDTKMADYAAAVPEGGVSADLLELLILGPPSDELEIYLLQKLTVNDLKKFGNSIELSYSTIQKLVLKQLNIVGQSLTYYLSELRGLTRIPDRFRVIGIEEHTVTEAIRACCAFLNKCLELQQVIDTSMRNYKAFFRWLFVALVRLLGEQTPTEIVKITQQDSGHIAEFLCSFDNLQAESSENLPEKPVKFNLERLGQYLDDKDLTILPDDEDNPWHKFLKEHTCLLNDNDTIFNLLEFRKYSLVQQQKHLRSAVGEVFNIAHRETGQYFSTVHNIKCYEDKAGGKLIENMRACQTYHAEENRFMIAFLDSGSDPNTLHFMSLKIKDKACSISAVKYYFTGALLGDKNQDDINLRILDLQFYSPEYLSALVIQPQVEDSSIFIQLPLPIALTNACEGHYRTKQFLFNDKTSRKNITPLIETGVFKVLDKMDGSRIAVSGGRKVAVVLSKSLRKVRIFEMGVDGDDEEDDTLDTTPQSISSNNQSALDKNTTPVADDTF